MRKHEREVLKNLPDKLKIYRAMTVEEAESGKYNVSWTLDYDRAKFFRDDYPRNYAVKDKEKTIIDLEIDKQKEIIYVHNKPSSLPVDELMNEIEKQHRYSENEINNIRMSTEMLNRHLFP